MDCKKMVIDHEVAHIKRFDNFIQLIQIVTQALYFFHPLVFLLNGQFKKYREMACDDLSIKSQNQASRVQFSRYLIEIAETALRKRLCCDSVSALIRQKSELLERVQFTGKLEPVCK